MIHDLAMVVVGFCIGLLSIGFGRAATLNNAPLRLVEEDAEQHIRNALQVLAGWTFLNGEERAGAKGLEVITAAIQRLKQALTQLQKVA